MIHEIWNDATGAGNKVMMQCSNLDRIFPQIVAYYKSNKSKGAFDMLKSVASELEKLKREGSMGPHNIGYARVLTGRVTDPTEGFGKNQGHTGSASSACGPKKDNLVLN